MVTRTAGPKLGPAVPVSNSANFGPCFRFSNDLRLGQKGSFLTRFALSPESAPFGASKPRFKTSRLSPSTRILEQIADDSEHALEKVVDLYSIAYRLTVGLRVPDPQFVADLS